MQKSIGNMQLCWMLYFLPVAFAFDRRFVEPVVVTEKAEYYDLEDVYYVVYYERKSFSQAEKFCSSRDGKLAELHDEKIAKFLGRALTRSSVGYTSLWVGGKLQTKSGEKQGKYIWISNRQEIEIQGATFPQTSYPYWVSSPLMVTDEPYCVAMDKRSYEDPLIVELPCSVHRPFICTIDFKRDNIIKFEKEKSQKLTSKENIEENPDATCDLGESTESRDQCGINKKERKEKKIKEEEEKKEKENKKTCENDLTGENCEENPDTTCDLSESTESRDQCGIKKKEKKMMKKKMEEGDENKKKEKKEGKKKTCENDLTGENCEERGSFMNDEVKYMRGQEELVQIGSSSLWISKYEATWHKAVKKCWECFKNPHGQLLTLDSDVSEKIKGVYQGMSVTLNKELRHLWIGGHVGKLDKNNYYWMTYKIIKGKESWTNAKKIDEDIKFDITEIGGYYNQLPQMTTTQNVYNSEYPCLNLDRENHKGFFTYGLECDMKQHFVCDGGKVNAKLDSKCYRNLEWSGHRKNDHSNYKHATSFPRG